MEISGSGRPRTPSVGTSSSSDDVEYGDIQSLFLLRDKMFRDELFKNDLTATADDYDRMRWYAECLMLLELPIELQEQFVNIVERVQLAAQQAVGSFGATNSIERSLICIQ